MSKKNFKWIIFVLILIGLPLFVLTRGHEAYYLMQKLVWGHEFLRLEQARKKWGQADFDSATFRANQNREKMVVDLIKKKRLIGLRPQEVRAILGEPDGAYFLSDEMITYSIYLERDAQERILESYCLLIRFDANQNVNAAHIWKDR